MIVMVCVDNQNGMMFNHRRQSQDRVLRRRMCEIAGNDDGKFWMNAYSRKMFTDSDTEGTQAQLCVAEDFMKQAASGDFCLLETEDPADYAANLEELILFSWYRDYPADLHFTLDLSGWKQVETAEYAGSSHEKITETHYVR